MQATNTITQLPETLHSQNGTFYIKHKNRHIPIELGVVSFGPRSALELKNLDAGIHLVILCNIGQAVLKLEEITRQLRASICTKNEAAIIRAEDGREEMARPLTLADIRPEDPEDYKIALLIDHFSKTPGLQDVADLLRQDYKSITGKAYKSGSNGKSQLDLDLEAVKPHLDKIRQDGEFVHGHQTRIAEALGITNAGSSNRARILDVVSRLENAA